MDEEGYLLETDIVGIFTEALTAEIKVILADETSAVSAHTTICLN